jgi:hypothetical protein
MAKIEIQRGEWTRFFNSFSKQHQNWLIIVEVNDTGNPKILVKSLPLRGISSDGSNGINLIMGNENEEFEHNIVGIESITLEQTNEGAHKELMIKSENGTVTVLRFLSVALPETVDGIVFS